MQIIEKKLDAKILSLQNAVKYLRLKKSLSARQLSIEAGLSPTYISKLENGTLSPSFEAFCSISKVLNMTDQEVLYLIKLQQGKDDK